MSSLKRPFDYARSLKFDDYHSRRIITYQCIIPLIDGSLVRNAGAFLQNHSIKLCTPGRRMDLMPALGLRSIFSAGMQQLRTFFFK